jgi:hypothetical protein
MQKAADTKRTNKTNQQERLSNAVKDNVSALSQVLVERHLQLSRD